MKVWCDEPLNGIISHEFGDFGVCGGGGGVGRLGGSAEPLAPRAISGFDY